MVNFWQRKYYFCCNESAQLSLEKNTLATEAISKYERETASLHSLWQQTVIARECSLRTKPSPSTRERLLYVVRSNKKMSLREGVLCERSHLQVRERDSFTSFAVTTNCHCERAYFATEAISALGGRWFRGVYTERSERVRHDRHRQGDGLALLMMIAVFYSTLAIKSEL
jgi:hypothetical protein